MRMENGESTCKRGEDVWERHTGQRGLREECLGGMAVYALQLTLAVDLKKVPPQLKASILVPLISLKRS